MTASTDSCRSLRGSGQWFRVLIGFKDLVIKVLLGLAASTVTTKSLSLRQLSFANPLQPCISAQISFCFKRVCRNRPNLRDWQDGDFRSLNGFRLFPSEPRRIWFGQRKRNVSSRLPIRVDRTFHRSSAARHSIRDTRSGRCAARGCAGLRMHTSLNDVWVW